MCEYCTTIKSGSRGGLGNRDSAGGMSQNTQGGFLPTGMYGPRRWDDDFLHERLNGGNAAGAQGEDEYEDGAFLTEPLCSPLQDYEQFPPQYMSDGFPHIRAPQCIIEAIESLQEARRLFAGSPSSLDNYSEARRRTETVLAYLKSLSKWENYQHHIAEGFLTIAEGLLWWVPSMRGGVYYNEGDLRDGLGWCVYQTQLLMDQLQMERTNVGIQWFDFAINTLQHRRDVLDDRR